MKETYDDITAHSLYGITEGANKEHTNTALDHILKSCLTAAKKGHSNVSFSDKTLFTDYVNDALMAKGFNLDIIDDHQGYSVTVSWNPL